MFPDVPIGVLNQVAGDDALPGTLDPEGTPWNHRRRRSILKAKPGEVLIHLFAGQQKWRVPGILVEVEKARGSNLLAKNVWQHLLVWACSGVVGGVIGGPRCRTCEGSGRWGLPGLPGNLAGLVTEDNILWLRCLFLYAVAQAAADGPPNPSEGLADAGLLEGCSVFPDGITDAVDLAKWALKRAAANLHTRETGGFGTQIGGRRVLFGWEHPRDPEEYLEGEQVPEGGWTSFCAFPEWSYFRDMFGVYVAHFDQGKLGHARPKTTTFATTSWWLYENLDQHFLTPLQRAEFGKGPILPQSRLKEVPYWASWAPGLSHMVRCAWGLWFREQEKQSDVEERRVFLARLTEAERIQRHERNDHVPFRRGCPVCLGAQARQRSHWASCTNVHSLSCDIAGPFKNGRSYDPTASGRDRGGGYRYFLAFAFTVPIFPVGAGVGLIEDPARMASVYLDPEGSDGVGGEDLPGLLPVFSLGSESGLKGAPVVDKVTHRIREKGPEPADVPDPQGDVPPAVPTRTLFMGVPLRTKKAKEVLPAVQAVVNKLEAFGFPVHRYHADRAQELKSKALVSWCRDRGIHPTWTPGESPAGNKAELAVQQLKGLTRKLLHVAGLDSDFWPLALLHASRRHWVALCQDLGIVQPVLLPFGLELLARQRARSGYESHWRSRTVKGVYLGHAPDTPGGHLVLVTEEAGDRKVLLTNSVYPLSPRQVDPAKPRFRLRDKTTPHLVKTLVFADSLSLAPPVSARDVARLAPGGEWDQNDWEFDGSECDLDSVSDSGERHLKDQGENPGREFRDLWSETMGMLKTWDSEEEQRPLLGKGVKESSEVTVMPGEFLSTCQAEGRYDFASCLKVLRECVNGFPRPRRPGLEGDRAYAILGLYSHGGMIGVTSFARKNPELTQYLNGFVERHFPGGNWTTLYLARNTIASIHKDSRNFKRLPAWIVALGSFQGGGLWVGSADGKGSILKRLPDGSVKSGHVLDIHERPQLFDSHMWHEPWVGTDRWVLVAYVPGRLEALGSEQRQALVELGFSVKGLYGLGTGEVSVSQCKASVSSEACDEGQDAVSGPACSEFASSWEVELPCEILDPGQFEQAVSLHHRYVEYCSRIAGELDRAVEWGCGGQVSKLLRVARLECGWFEGVLKRWSPVEEVHTSLKGLTTDIPLGEQELEAAEVFLQTRTVSLDEARKELEKWKGPGQDEVTALEETTGAVERVTVEQVEEWIRAGYKVMQVPGKAVLTRKAGVGRRRLRAVCCGNYLPAESLGLAKSDLYAGGVEALTVRVVLVYVASRPDWCGCILDVKCAFLYAPARSIQEDAEKQTIIVVRPPYLLVQLGLLGPQHRWKIIRALYGLQTSPKDWALYRDQELKGLEVSFEDEVLTLFQGISDDSLWFAKNATGEVRALVVVYVDDIGLFGPRLVLRALVDKLREKWNTSEPVWSSDETLLNFCGVELQQLKMGWRLTQRAYLQELLQRYEVESTASVPIARWTLRMRIVVSLMYVGHRASLVLCYGL